MGVSFGLEPDPGRVPIGPRIAVYSPPASAGASISGELSLKKGHFWFARDETHTQTHSSPSTRIGVMPSRTRPSGVHMRTPGPPQGP